MCSLGEGRVELAWRPAYSPGSRVTYYRIEKSGDKTAWSELNTVPAQSGQLETTYVYTGLQEESTSYFRLLAANDMVWLVLHDIVASCSQVSGNERARSRLGRVPWP